MDAHILKHAHKTFKTTFGITTLKTGKIHTAQEIQAKHSLCAKLSSQKNPFHEEVSGCFEASLKFFVHLLFLQTQTIPKQSPKRKNLPLYINE